MRCGSGHSRKAASHRGQVGWRVYVWLAAGRGRPALPKRETIFQTNTCPWCYTRGRTRNAPTLFDRKKRLSRDNAPITHLPTSYALRVRHSRKVASRHGQAFNSVLYQTLVISLTPILDRGESPHRWLFCYFFLHLKKVEHYSFVSFLKKRLFYLPQSKAVAAANFISALSCRCRNSNPPCRRPRTPNRWAGARGKRGNRWL